MRNIQSRGPVIQASLSSKVSVALDTFIKESERLGKKMVLCVSDAAGNPMLVYRMPGAWLGSLKIAQDKAWTAVAFSGPTEDEALTTEKLAEMVVPGESLYGIQNTNDGNVVVFGGGIPVYENGLLTGSVGVSGSTVEDDVTVAQAVVDAVSLT